MTDAEANVDLVAGRSCGSCTLCCKLLRIAPLNKPAGIWCTHCKQGTGCTIYETRPDVCRKFYCSYRITDEIPEVWNPLKSKIMLRADPGGIVAFVDPGRPNAWREEPYYSHLKQWASPTGKRQHQVVVVRVGMRTIAVLPDRDVDLGTLESGERVVVKGFKGPTGIVYEAYRAPAKPDTGAPADRGGTPGEESAHTADLDADEARGGEASLAI